MIDQAHMRQCHPSAVVAASSWRLSPLTRTALTRTAAASTAAARVFVEGDLEAGTTGFDRDNTKRHNPCPAHSHRARPT
ncbi:MAG: hypothetical protein O3C27_09615 [Actinomycetota bacterium]|nr:hypothetical protein [Actinomycetota bacterium]